MIYVQVSSDSNPPPSVVNVCYAADTDFIVVVVFVTLL